MCFLQSSILEKRYLQAICLRVIIFIIFILRFLSFLCVVAVHDQFFVNIINEYTYPSPQLFQTNMICKKMVIHWKPLNVIMVNVIICLLRSDFIGSIILVLLLQWKRLNRITLGQRQTDSINRPIIIISKLASK